MNASTNNYDKLKSELFGDLCEHFHKTGLSKGLTDDDIHKMFPQIANSDFKMMIADLIRESKITPDTNANPTTYAIEIEKFKKYIASIMNASTNNYDKTKSKFFGDLCEHFHKKGLNKGLTEDDIHKIFPKIAKGAVDAMIADLLSEGKIIPDKNANPTTYEVVPENRTGC